MFEVEHLQQYPPKYPSIHILLNWVTNFLIRRAKSL
jgi:hypothetical protein